MHWNASRSGRCSFIPRSPPLITRMGWSSMRRGRHICLAVKPPCLRISSSGSGPQDLPPEPRWPIVGAPPMRSRASPAVRLRWYRLVKVPHCCGTCRWRPCGYLRTGSPPYANWVLSASAISPISRARHWRSASARNCTAALIRRWAGLPRPLNRPGRRKCSKHAGCSPNRSAPRKPWRAIPENWSRGSVSSYKPRAWARAGSICCSIVSIARCMRSALARPRRSAMPGA
jgi:hypothetical protein